MLKPENTRRLPWLCPQPLGDAKRTGTPTTKLKETRIDVIECENCLNCLTIPVFNSQPSPPGTHA
jgi:hypothetical protein